MPVVTTLIASAVDSVPDGDFSLVRLSSVTPERSSRNTVTTRRISSSRGRQLRQVERASERGNAAGDDVDLVVEARRQRQHDSVETAPQRGRELVHPTITIVRGGDHVETLGRLHFDAELGTGSVFSEAS